MSKAKGSPVPSDLPSSAPSLIPSAQPTRREPSALPTGAPSSLPSGAPSDSSSSFPSLTESTYPSALPSRQPSALPTGTPSDSPSVVPSVLPTLAVQAEIVDLVYAFPGSVYEELFGISSTSDFPYFTFPDLMESVGSYSGTNEHGTTVTLSIYNITDPSEGFTESLLQEAELEPDILTEEESIAELEVWFQATNFSGFILMGNLTTDLGTVAVEAVVGKTTNTSEYVLYVTGDPNISDEIEALDVVDATRRLSETPGWCPGGALSRALNELICLPPDQLKVENACVTAARLAYEANLLRQNEIFQAAVEAAKLLAKRKKRRLLRQQAKKTAILLSFCAILAAVPGAGWLAAAACAARVLARMALWYARKCLVVKAALALAEEIAKNNLDIALIALCEALLLAMKVKEIVGCTNSP